jgi:hypothetical protein
MEKQVRVEFEGMTASPELRTAIDHYVAEKRFGRLTAGRIVVRGPGDHHQTGGQYQARAAERAGGQCGPDEGLNHSVCRIRLDADQ